MSDLVPATDIESIVGARRHLLSHLGRAVSAEQKVYVLHSQQCLDTESDLRECVFSVALDKGITPDRWEHHEDQTVQLGIHKDGRLDPWDYSEGTMSENTTSTGTTVTVEDSGSHRVVICDNPAAPAAMRHCEAGRLIDGGFQPAFMAAWALSPEVLRIIANLAEQEAGR